MDAGRMAARMRYGTIAVLVFAALMCIWAVVLGVRVAADSSVVGGIAIIVIAALALCGVSWRLRFNWQRSHDRSA
jgi:phosphate/sulfate permease